MSGITKTGEYKLNFNPFIELSNKTSEPENLIENAIVSAKSVKGKPVTLKRAPLTEKNTLNVEEAAKKAATNQRRPAVQKDRLLN